MFCPECKAEYVDGISQCADCHVSLVWELAKEPEEAQGEHVEWEVLATLSSQADIALVKSILDGDDILYWIQGEHRGMVPHGMELGAIFHVDKTQLDDAKTLLSEHDLNIISFSTRTTDEMD